MLPLYYHANSPIHLTPAPYKLVLCLGLSAALVFIPSVWGMATATLAIAALYAVARLPLRTVLAALRPVVIATVIIFALHAAFSDWHSAVLIVLRLMALVLLSTLVSLTTPFSDMLDVLSRAARPFARFGVSPPNVALAVALTIRFIPTLLHDMQEIQRARMARGGKRASLFALGPLIVKILSMTNALGNAIAARGFENRK
ncbi:MAG: energy-coupling factor transporter transmembrane protein EcfT [Alphaproteobacteria bacterium]